MKDYLIIDRSKWITGSHGKRKTELLNNEKYMCCLGFRCNQMGIPKKGLLGKSNPSDLSNDWDIPDLLIDCGKSVFHNNLTKTAISINDNTQINNKIREKKLKKLFSNYQITVEFTGRYGKK